MRRLLLGLAMLACLGTLSVGVASADCADTKLFCIKIVNGRIYNDGAAIVKGRLSEGNCWKDWKCKNCRGETFADFAGKCNAQFSGCEGNCAACSVSKTEDAISSPCIDKNGTSYPLTP